MKENNIDILKSDLLIVKQQYEELISYDKGFKDKQELQEYYTKLGELSITIKQLNEQIEELEGGNGG
jgi:hypothetical protein